jgi:hypothetical protein
LVEPFPQAVKPTAAIKRVTIAYFFIIVLFFYCKVIIPNLGTLVLNTR